MGDINWIYCGHGKRPKTQAGVRFINLDATSSNPNVHLKLENISNRLYKNIPDIVLDLLQVGSYVYAADQTVARGGKTLRGDGVDWRRKFHFNIPVHNPEVWNSPEVKDTLRSTLSFLSDDYYEFDFRAPAKDPTFEQFIDFENGAPWFKADEIALFSGGLDSFAGLCHATIAESRKVVLVGHRAAPQISKRQLDLLNDFRLAARGASEFLHVPVWVNKGASLTRDNNQRTRSFLFAMLGAAVAEMLGLSKISFYENGIVSFNLTDLEQVVGARATRSTHPKALHGMSKLLTLLLEKDFKIESPFMWKTRAEVMQTVCDLGLKQLISSTNSCAHVRTGDPISTHCGVCSQCVDRRFAAIYCSVGENDPEEMYRIRLPLDPITGTEDRAMTEHYVRFAREMKMMTIDQFYAKYGKAVEALPFVGLKSSEAARQIFELHHRHGEQVCAVIESQIKVHADIIANGNVNPDSLLGMVIDQKAKAKVVDDTIKRFPAIPGLTWEDITIEVVSLDSVRIRAGGVVKTYTGYDMGFRDGRKQNALNKQWDLLCYLAETDGVVSTQKTLEKKGLYKHFSVLRRTLQLFFSLTDSPISTYDKIEGWRTQFKITNKMLRP